MKVEVIMEFYKETKNMVVFEGKSDHKICGNVYVDKETIKKLGDPTTLRITIQGVQE